MSLLIDALKRNAHERPHKIAICDGQKDITWNALHEQVTDLADKLVDISCLAILLNNSPAWIVADFAALKIEAACVPIPPFFSAEQISHSLADAAVDTIITDSPERLTDLIPVARQARIEIAGQELSLLTINSVIEPRRENIAKITYTSGTTGNPKGVPLSLNRIESVAGALCAAVDGNETDRALAILPLSTLLENIGSIYVPLLAGASILVPSPQALGIQGSSKLDAEKFTRALLELNPSSAILTPELLKLFVGLAAKKLLPQSLRFIAVGGAPVAKSLLVKAQKRGLPVFQGYGLSEAGSVVALNIPTSNRIGSVGKVLNPYQVRIADDGEILIKGSGFPGYLHASNAEPVEWLATGDLGHLDDDGYLFVNGRKRQVIINSFSRNISPEWVESEMLGEPAISQIAVFGNDRSFLTAVITPAENATSQDLAAALARVNQKLPDYARILGHVRGDGFSPLRNELTANGRPRHEEIYQNYQVQLEQLYEVQNEHIL
jgi:long-chain acyl-CoA synthetase